MNIYCHRGVFDNKVVIENTIDAFKMAVNLSLGIELDIRITKDKKIVVFHDDSLLRLTGKDILIKDITYDELCSITLLNTNSKIPLLSEVLKLVGGRVPLLIEIKEMFSNKMIRKLDSLLLEYNGVVLFQSFNPFLITRLSHSSLKRYKLGILVFDKYKGIKRYIYNTYIYGNLIKKDYCNFISCSMNLTLKIKEISKKELFIWTIKTKEEFIKYKKYSNNLICEKSVLCKINL